MASMIIHGVHFLLIAATACADVLPGWTHEFDVERLSLPMRDGVRLAATVYRPRPRNASEKYPVLLELLPYRKDDSFYLRDHRHYSWFAGHGFLAVKVDVRGTGSSGGRVPGREYSEAEIDDGVEIVRQLAGWPEGTGRVGMWGISWGGFNAIQVAMRRPPGLGAILAVDASDDLFHDDIRYHDGILHFEPYHLEIDHENGLPRSPDYVVNAEYFRDRFDVEPWFFEYMRHPREGPFWSKGSLRGQYHRLEVPVFLIGGLQDGYRDSIPRMLEHVRAPVQAWIGPWDHDFPDTGTPGPNHDWRRAAAAWWNRWLRPGSARPRSDERRFLVYVRRGHPPDMELKQAPGSWREESWPIARTRWRTLVAGARGELVEDAALRGTLTLPFVAGQGTSAGEWWGGGSGDMAQDDRHALVFDSNPVQEAIEIAGFPRVTLRTSVDSPQATWIARLEDRAPDGRVTLITGAALARSPAPGRSVDLAFDLHFTTWTFRPGHRIRLAITTAQFPMFWPPSRPVTMRLEAGDAATSLSLPVLPGPPRTAAPFPPPEPLLERPDARDLEGGTGGWIREAGVNRYRMEQSYAYEIQGRPFEVEEECLYTTRPSFEGRMLTRLPRKGRPPLELETRVAIRGKGPRIAVTVRRQLRSGPRTLRTRTWSEESEPGSLPGPLPGRKVNPVHFSGSGSRGK